MSGPTPSELSDLQETLQGTNVQLWSLRCALLAMTFSLWSLRNPSACVSYTPEQALAPMRCSALREYPDAKAHLQSFCYMNCGSMNLNIFACSVVLGFLLQSLVVLPSWCGCGQFLRITLSTDFTNEVAVAREAVGNRFANWCQRAFDFLNGIAQFHSRQLPLHMRHIYQLAKLLYAVALLQLLFEVISSLHLIHNGVSFRCESPSDTFLLVEPVRYRPLQVSGKISPTKWVTFIFG